MTNTPLSNEAGFFYIRKAVLKNFAKTSTADLSRVIISLDLNESIHRLSITGTITITDSVGLVNRFPIIGEETLEMELEDFYGNIYNPTFWVYTVSSETPSPQNKSVTYSLGVASIETLASETTRIRKSFVGSTSDIAGQVYEQYIFPETEKSFNVEETDDVKTLIVPGLSVLQTLNFVARRAYSQKSINNDFYFFENREGFHLVSFERLLSRPVSDMITFTYDSTPILPGGDNLESQMNNIINLTFPNTVNTFDDISRGGMISNVIELDVLNKKVDRWTYSLNDNYIPTLDKRQALPHTPEFIERYFSSSNVVKNFLFVHDTSREPQYYKEIALPRITHRSRMEAHRATILVHGRNDLHAGRIVSLNIPEFEGSTDGQQLNKKISGRYLIESVDHHMFDQKYSATCHLIKDAVQKDVLVGA